MTFRRSLILAALATLGFAEAAAAQPIAPPRRPTFSTYNNIYSQASTGYGFGGYGGLYGGFAGGGWGGGGWGNQGQNALMMQQNQMLSQQLSSFNQNVSSLQQFLATGVNPNFPTTGHASTFNNLGHWYSGGAGGGGGGVMSGGFTTGRTAGIGMPLGANTKNTGNPAAAAGGANQPRTAGTGIPIGPRR